jgi:hypothetical protein
MHFPTLTAAQNHPGVFKHTDGFSYRKARGIARHQRLTPVILATQEAEIRRIMVRNQPQANR